MKFSSLLLALAFFPGAFAPDPAGGGTFTTSEALVMEEGDIWLAGESRQFHNNRCRVKLQHDGNMIVNRLIAPNPYYQYYNHAWSTGAQGTGNYYAMLNDHDGSLEVYRENIPQDELMYSSNVGDPEVLDGLVSQPRRNHALTINEECVLTIRRDDVFLWTNNHYGGLSGAPGTSNFLQRGEMMHVNVCLPCAEAGECIYVPHTLHLQLDCNLVQFRGQDKADHPEYPDIIWTSGSRRTDIDDCYLYSDADKVRLYEGTLDKSLAQFDPRAGASFWEAGPDFQNPCAGSYEVLLKASGGLEASC